MRFSNCAEAPSCRKTFYKYVSVWVAKVILVNRKMRWSSPLLFDDPFDITQELRLDFDEKELSRMVQEEFQKMILNHPANLPAPTQKMQAFLDTVRNLRYSQRKNLVRQLQQTFSPVTTGQETAMQKLRQEWADMVPTFRVLCLSERNDIVPMWVNYAHESTGVVLELRCVKELDSPYFVARPVKYTDSPPAIADVQVWARVLLGSASKTFRDLFTELEYVKSTDWAYQREWRIVSFMRPGESGKFSDYGFDPRELSAVYFGSACSEKDQSEICALLKNGFSHAGVYKMQIDYRKGGYKIFPIEK